MLLKYIPLDLRHIQEYDMIDRVKRSLLFSGVALLLMLNFLYNCSLLSAAPCRGGSLLTCSKSGCKAPYNKSCRCPKYCKGSPYPCKNLGNKGLKNCDCGPYEWGTGPTCLTSRCKMVCANHVQPTNSIMWPCGEVDRSLIVYPDGQYALCCPRPVTATMHIDCTGPDVCYKWCKIEPNDDSTFIKPNGFCGGNDTCITILQYKLALAAGYNQSACQYMRNHTTSDCGIRRLSWPTQDVTICQWFYDPIVFGSAGCKPQDHVQSAVQWNGPFHGYPPGVVYGGIYTPTLGGCAIKFTGSCACDPIGCGNNSHWLSKPLWRNLTPTPCSCKDKKTSACVSTKPGKNGLCICHIKWYTP